MFLTSAIRTLGWIIACALVASLVSHAMRRLTGAQEASMIAAHLLYVGALAWCVARGRGPASQSPAPPLLAAVAATGLLALLAVLGAVIHGASALIGSVLMESLTLGYYPPGADVPFQIGGLIWSLSMLALTGAALLTGGFVRSRRAGSADG